jgi:hypothetical protein
MSYIPSFKSLTQQTIITLVAMVVAGVIISKFPALQKIVNPT